MNVSRDPQILTKRQNYRLWQSGEFGNKLRAWPSVDAWRASGFTGRVVLRALLPVGGGPCRYNLEPDEVERTVGYWLADGMHRDAIMVNEAAPDQAAILQGEYLNGIVGAYWNCLHYSRVAAHMRIALGAEMLFANGMMSDLLLREAMTPSSYEDWRLLLERYPGHVLEVSIYNRCVGDIPGRNALVWEVRRY